VPLPASDDQMALYRPRLICITGIDGSGKTTLAQRLVSRLREAYPNVQHVHSFHFPILLKPFKVAARFLFVRGTDEFGNYLHYRDRKISASRRHRFLSKLYGGIWFLDYCLQAFFRVALPNVVGKTIVADRYIFDAALNVCLSIDLPIHTAYRLIDLFFQFNPRPDVVFLIDLPEEIAFARKNDIQSVEYLRERRDQYLVMAERFGFHILDGLAKPEDLLSEVLIRCAEMAQKPVNRLA